MVTGWPPGLDWDVGPWHTAPCLWDAKDLVQLPRAAHSRPPPHSRSGKRTKGKRRRRGGVLPASDYEYTSRTDGPRRQTVVCPRSRVGSPQNVTGLGAPKLPP